MNFLHLQREAEGEKQGGREGKPPSSHLLLKEVT